MSAENVSQDQAFSHAPATGGKVGRALVMVYGIVCYAMFVGTFTYLIGFVGNLVVPKSIDSGAPAALPVAVLVDVLVMALFGVQHSVMARASFKAWWTKFVPTAIERSTYVLLTCVALIVMYLLWQPIPTPLWTIEQPVVRGIILVLFASGWVLVLLSSFMINHFDLFGLRQVFLNLRGEEYKNLGFRTTALYRFLRHPLLLGILIAVWAAPAMTVGHLLFSIVMTVYVLIGIHFEERDMLRAFGEQYRHYKESTPMLIPGKPRQ